MALKTMNDLLDVAIDHEISSQNFFENILITQKNSQVQNFIQTLIEEEKNHKFLLTQVKQLEIFDGSIIVDDDMIDVAQRSHSVSLAGSTQDFSIEEILEIALKREIHAFNLFKNLAENCSNNDLKTFFENLADEEMVHYQNIEQEYRSRMT